MVILNSPLLMPFSWREETFYCPATLIPFTVRETGFARKAICRRKYNIIPLWRAGENRIPSERNQYLYFFKSV